MKSHVNFLRKNHSAIHDDIDFELVGNCCYDFEKEVAKPHCIVRNRFFSIRCYQLCPHFFVRTNMDDKKGS